MRLDETPGAAARKEQRLSGIGVSPGIAIGPAYIGDRGELPVSESRIAESDIETERARFAEAVATSAKQLRKLKSRATALPASSAGSTSASPASASTPSARSSSRSRRLPRPSRR
jgi:phosphotransferase system enzyme I (PtsI)